MEDIYEALAQAGSAYKLPSPWHNIPCDPSFFCLPDDKAALLAELQRQFSAADLTKAGVVTTGATNIVVWHPDLVVVGVPIWAIRSKPNQKPTALIAQLRTVGKNTWVVHSAFQDHRQSKLVAAADDQVVVAYSMTDVAILRSIGLAVVPGGRWNRLTKSQLDFLCRKLRITSQSLPPATLGAAWMWPEATGPKATGPKQTQPLSLILANWSLAAVDPTDSGAATTSWAHLGELYRHLELAFETFGLWKPSQSYLKQLGYQLEYQDVKLVRAGLLNSMAEDATAMDADLSVKRPPARTIVEAYRAWQLAERNPMNPVGRQKAYEQLFELLDRQRFDPLLEEALQASNPLERNAELALAETSRLLQPLAQVLTEKIRRSIAEKGTRAGSIITKEELEQVLALSDSLLALTHGVIACRRNKPAKTSTSLKPQAARSRPSASVPQKLPRSGRTEPSHQNAAAAKP
jgi:hypothetical protein